MRIPGPGILFQWRFVLFLFLVLLTFLLHTTVARYTVVGQQLLNNNDFSLGLEGWNVVSPQGNTVYAEGGMLFLESAVSDTYVGVVQQVSASALTPFVLLRASLRAEGIRPGPDGWNRGRVLLAQMINGKLQWKLPHQMVGLEGDVSEQNYETVFYLKKNTSAVNVRIELSRCLGRLFCDTIELYNLHPNLLYLFVKCFVIGVWLLFCLFLFGSRLRQFSSSRRILFVALLLVVSVVVGTSMPGSLKNMLKAKITDGQQFVIQSLVSSDNQSGEENEHEAMVREYRRQPVVDITKVAHFVLFAFLAVALLYGGKENQPACVLGDLFMLACATELMQLFVDGRTALVSDVGIDMAGALLGYAFYRLVLRGCVCKKAG